MTKIKLDENFVAEHVRKLMEGLGVSATAEVSRIEKTFFIDIASEDSSLLIGKHGQNLESLQFVLAVRLKSTTGQDDFEVFIDVGDWRKNKEEKLKQMANSIAEKVSASSQPETLYNLKASERRVIHTFLTAHPQVITVSEGEGIDRHLIIKPR